MKQTVITGYLRCFAVALAAALLVSCAHKPAAETAPQPTSAAAEPPLLRSAEVDPRTALKVGYPQRYIVQPGDTLWHVASRFLAKPWHWQAMWQPSQGGEGAEPLYPGDVVEVFFQAGEPRLRLAENGQRPIIKLSPQVRVEAIDQPVPTVPREAVSGLLDRSRVVLEDELSGAPYVLGSQRSRLKFEAGTRFFARGELELPVYQVFRKGQEYRNPGSGAYLGTELIYLGEAIVEARDFDRGITQMLLTESRQGVREGDLLLPLEEGAEVFSFTPQAAPADAEGAIIAISDGGFQAVRNESVVINLGSADQIDLGSVLEVRQLGREISDPRTGQTVAIPGASSGTLMVYRLFDDVSFALIMESREPIRLRDRVVGL